MSKTKKEKEALTIIFENLDNNETLETTKFLVELLTKKQREVFFYFLEDNFSRELELAKEYVEL